MNAQVIHELPGVVENKINYPDYFWSSNECSEFGRYYSTTSEYSNYPSEVHTSSTGINNAYCYEENRVVPFSQDNSIPTFSSTSIPFPTNPYEDPKNNYNLGNYMDPYRNQRWSPEKYYSFDGNNQHNDNISNIGSYASQPYPSSSSFHAEPSFYSTSLPGGTLVPSLNLSVKEHELIQVQINDTLPSVEMKNPKKLPSENEQSFKSIKNKKCHLKMRVGRKKRCSPSDPIPHVSKSLNNFICEFGRCGFTASRRSNVTRHIEAMHESHYIVCCKTLYPTKTHFEKHRLDLHGDGMFKCVETYCNRSFNRKAILHKHESIYHKQEINSGIFCCVCFLHLPHPIINENVVKCHAISHSYSG